MVSFVFKLIGISIMAMIIMDTSIMLVDAFTTNGRVQAQANLMEQEIAKNNYLPATAATTFYGYYTEYPDGTSEGTGFAYIEGLSNVYTDITFNDEELLEVKNYGEYQTLKIDATINPWHYYFSGVVRNGEGIRKVESTSVIHYVYTIPCLRYLK